MPEMNTLGESHFLDTLQYLIGFLLVIGVLILLWLMTLSIGYLFQRKAERQAQKEAVPSGSSSRKPSAGEAIDPQTIAVIAAAVHSAFHEPVRVISIQKASSGWSTEGRRQIFASHRVR